jgi:hypothetical protein
MPDDVGHVRARAQDGDSRHREYVDHRTPPLSIELGAQSM